LHHHRTAFLIGCLGLGFMGACSRDAHPPGPASAHPATAEAQTLNVYNWSDFIDPSVISDFEKESGIKVHYDVYDSDEIMEAKLLAGHSSYDLVIPGGAFLEKEIKAGVYQPLDKTLLPNLKNLDPAAVLATAALDPGNRYGVDYTWLASIGLGFDTQKISARVPGTLTDSWALLFDPKNTARLADCGISVLDSPDDVVSAALYFLGKDPNQESLDDLKLAENLLAQLRPHLRYIDTAKYVADLANGDLCVALGWSGDVAQARLRAKEANTHVTLGYSIPKEGSQYIVDVMAIPADAPHPVNAHTFINYLLRPEIAARNSMATTFASGVAGSVALVSDAVRNDDAVYPSASARSRLVPMRARSQEYTRAMMRMWTRFKTGQ
jgi:putrescine transport system substrate-binding protein